MSEFKDKAIITEYYICRYGEAQKRKVNTKKRWNRRSAVPMIFHQENISNRLCLMPNVENKSPVTDG